MFRLSKYWSGSQVHKRKTYILLPNELQKSIGDYKKIFKEYKDLCSYEGFAYSDGSSSEIDGDEHDLDLIPSTFQKKDKKRIFSSIENGTCNKKFQQESNSN